VFRISTSNRIKVYSIALAQGYWPCLLRASVLLVALRQWVLGLALLVLKLALAHGLRLLSQARGCGGRVVLEH